VRAALIELSRAIELEAAVYVCPLATLKESAANDALSRLPTLGNLALCDESGALTLSELVDELERALRPTCPFRRLACVCN
jgi:hypothetical protein